MRLFELTYLSKLINSGTPVSQVTPAMSEYNNQLISSFKSSSVYVLQLRNTYLKQICKNITFIWLNAINGRKYSGLN